MNEIEQQVIEELKDLYETETSYTISDKITKEFYSYCSKEEYLKKYFEDSEGVPVRYLMSLNGETELFIKNTKNWIFMYYYKDGIDLAVNSVSSVFSELGKSFYLISEAAGSALKSMSNISVKSEVIKDEPKDKVLEFIESKKKSEKHYQKFTKQGWTK